MYQQMLKICSSNTGARGPATDPRVVLTNPDHQNECIHEVIASHPREKFSRYVSDLMDRLGYSHEMIKYRQHLFQEHDDIFNRKVRSKTVVTTGGKGEGTAIYHESDFDYMHVLTDVVCADNPQQFNDSSTLFKTERLDSPSGYTILRLIRLDGWYDPSLIAHCLLESEPGTQYLSSQLYLDACQTQACKNSKFHGLTTQQTSGPSTPLASYHYSYDHVQCFKCFCPAILERWVNRSRMHGWPSKESISEISCLDGHVVPVGMKGSENMYREWRICYTLAELHLMRDLNDTQIKVYILLKKICKSSLQQVCKDMTSYIMKNVVLWICEKNDISQFNTDFLMDRLFDCIKYLKSCIHENNLPSYMIPERNLLAGRVDVQGRQQLTKLLDDILHEGGTMLLRCDRIREGMIVMYLEPEMLREFGETRDKIESMELIGRTIYTETSKPGMSMDEHGRRLEQNVEYLIVFALPILALSMKLCSQDPITGKWDYTLYQFLS